MRDTDDGEAVIASYRCMLLATSAFLWLVLTWLSALLVVVTIEAFITRLK